jgi:hypothetical protein
MSEWGYTLNQALFEMPLGSALALWPALLARHGVEDGPNYIDRARQRARRAAKRYIAQHFTVVRADGSVIESYDA